MSNSRFSVEHKWQDERLDILEMAKTLGELDATHCSSEAAIASFILDKVWRRDRDHNVKFVAVVLQAYAKLLQDEGVKIV